MFSQTVEYALRAMLVLARNREGPLTGRQIAAAADVPPKYLTKILQSLARAELVTAVRGIGGGYALNAAAEQISMLEIVNCIDPIQRIKRCPLNRPEHRHKLCPLHRKLDAAIAATERAFADTSLAELIDDPADIMPPRHVPPDPAAVKVGVPGRGKAR
jgi:Rrf2 family protein